jgi:hypothetical protein
MITFYEKYNLASKLFLFNHETQVEFSLNLCLGNQFVPPTLIPSVRKG